MCFAKYSTELQTKIVKMQRIRLLVLLLLCVVCQQTFAQQRTISGLVISAEDHEPLIGATISVQGNEAHGVVTDIDGNFSIKLPAGAATLEFSYIGYRKQSLTVTGNTMNVQMTPDTQVMDEVVVIGYGTQKKDDLTGSITAVGEKDFNEGLISSPEQLINGKVAGVQIVSAGGSPTAGSTIRIRGGASLNASNDPLIVLDGVPMEIGGSVSGSGNFLSLINPNDIESMTILKDASSTAIYGSRASNGVIIITTKKGGGDKIKVSLQTTHSFQTKTKTADMLTRDEFIDVVNTYGTAAQKSLLGTANTDWNDEIFKTAYGTDNNLSVSGRLARNFPFRVSFGYTNQDGVLRTDNSTRYTGNINLSPSFFDDYLKFNLSVKGTWNNNRFAPTGTIWNASAMNPTIPVYSTDDMFGGYNEAHPAGTESVVTGAMANPVGEINQRDDKSKVYRFIGNLDIDYKMHFLPELRAHVSLGYDYSHGEGDVYVPANAYSYFTSGGRDYHYGPQENFNKLLTAYLNYNKEFDAINSTLDVTAGYDYQQWEYKNAAMEELNVNGVAQSTSAAADEIHGLISFYGRVNYSYASRYLLTATMRYDGSSRFSEDNRWGAFPSVALAWRISNEEFFKPINHVMNDLKLRFSYGITGQQDGIANYSYMPVYTISQNGAQANFGGVPLYTYRPEAYNPNLKWETTKAFNVGVDFGFLNNRITGSVDYYNRKTSDLLATVSIPAGINFAREMLSNVGNVKSSGVEIAVNATPIETKDWTWSISANATWLTNEITNLSTNAGSSDKTYTNAGTAFDSYYVQTLTEGAAPYAFYVYKQIYDEETGRPIEGLYADLNGDGTVNADDRYLYHSPAPDWMLGLSTSLRWKKWTLSTSLRASIGNYVYNGNAMSTGALNTMSYNSYQLNNLSSSFLDTRFTTRQYQSDYYVENASFLKMDNIQLGYNFGQVCKWFSLNVSAMVQNVFTVTKYSGVDPEVQSGIDNSVYPRPRIYSLTVGIDF